MRYGLRQLIHQPGFSLAAIASLALGIGLTTALFSVINAVLLRGSPISQPERLVEIYSGVPDYPQLTSSYPDYLSIRDGVDAFQAVAAHAFVRAILSGGERPRLVTGESVSANYFEVLGIPPAAGRSFTVDEERARGGAAVVVIGHGLWQREFGGQPGALGKTLQLSGRSYAIVGIAPRSMRGTVPGVITDFWVPVSMIDSFEFSGVGWSADNEPGKARLDQRGTRWLFLKGRLGDQRTVEQAARQVDSDLCRPAPGISGPVQERPAKCPAGRRDPLSSGDRRLCAYGQRGAARCRGPRAPDCLRQRGQHAARAQYRTQAGTGDSRGDRCGTRADRPATPW